MPKNDFDYMCELPRPGCFSHASLVLLGCRNITENFLSVVVPFFINNNDDHQQNHPYHQHQHYYHPPHQHVEGHLRESPKSWPDKDSPSERSPIVPGTSGI